MRAPSQVQAVIFCIKALFYVTQRVAKWLILLRFCSIFVLWQGTRFCLFSLVCNPLREEMGQISSEPRFILRLQNGADLFALDPSSQLYCYCLQFFSRKCPIEPENNSIMLKKSRLTESQKISFFHVCLLYGVVLKTFGYNFK